MYTSEKENFNQSANFKAALTLDHINQFDHSGSQYIKGTM